MNKITFYEEQEIIRLLCLHSHDAFMGFYFPCLFKSLTTLGVSCFYMVQSSAQMDYEEASEL